MFKKILAFLISFLIFAIYSYSQQQEERITITTYYPSPYGSYRELEVSNRLNVGDLSFAANFDTRLYVRNPDDAGTWLHPRTRYAVIGQTYDQNVFGALGRVWRAGLFHSSVYKAAVYGRSDAGDFAGYFSGDVMINGNVTINGRFPVSTCVDYTEGGGQQCPQNYYAVGCGEGSCAAPGRAISPCPRNGYMVCVRHAD